MIFIVDFDQLGQEEKVAYVKEKIASMEKKGHMPHSHKHAHQSQEVFAPKKFARIKHVIPVSSGKVVVVALLMIGWCW